ncbi:MAG: DUF1501 domain-containing protein [Fuerstiella sp.]|nr:DUF1501 domain-containing protein [Fuerstiella sp.]
MFHRREVLQIGCSSFFGLGLSSVLDQQASAASEVRRAKSVVLIYLTGGGSHIDMFDPKPEASEVKGEYDPIATTLSGVQFSDKMPEMAKRTDKLAIVRSMSHGDNRHLSSSHNTLTGAVQPFRGSSNQEKTLSRADWPSFGAATSRLRPRRDGLPSQVTLPNSLIEGPLVWPGQHAGFLGGRHDPLVLQGDPNSENYKARGLSLIEGLSVVRLDQRRVLLDKINRQHHSLDQSRQAVRFDGERERAFSMLTSPGLRGALDVHAESARTRDRYGRHQYGQTLLLARRLIELEMPVIQCNMGHVQMWDTHVNHFPRLKTMLPALDNGVSALLDDLEERGLMDQTLVVCVGEFGRTPTISPIPGQAVPGRHHWASVYTAVFAGGGVRGGQVIGQSDRIGGSPLTPPFHPNDIGATIYNALGINPHQTITDRFDRPRHLNLGNVMDVLYTGAAV